MIFRQCSIGDVLYGSAGDLPGPPPVEAQVAPGYLGCHQSQSTPMHGTRCSVHGVQAPGHYSADFSFHDERLVRYNQRQ
jgi:hypothetical protein